MTNILKSLTGISVLAAAAVSAPASAATTLLDFDGACDGPCTDGQLISDSYGDSALADVSYRSITADSGETFEGLRYWEGGYADLSGVVYGGTNGVNFIAEIAFTPTAGNEISLDSLVTASYLGRVTSSPFEIFSGSGDLLLSTVLPTPGTGAGHGFDTSALGYRADGYILRFGPDSYNVGVDNVEFSARAIGGGGVPEPATWGMLIIGFGAIGSSLRSSKRRKKMALAAA